MRVASPAVIRKRARTAALEKKKAPPPDQDDPAPAAAPAKDQPRADTPVEKPAADIPQAYRSARATMRTFLEAIRSEEFREAAECMDLSSIPRAARDEKGEELALNLYRVINWTEEVELLTISDDPEDDPYVFRSKVDRLLG